MADMNESGQKSPGDDRSSIGRGPFLVGGVLIVLGLVAAVVSKTLFTDPSPPPGKTDTSAKDDRRASNNAPASTRVAALTGAPLDDRVAYSDDWRMVDNPAADGWDTEVFYAGARKQLKRLAATITRGDTITADQLDHLASDEFRCDPLVPGDLAIVYRDKTIHVERSKRPGKTPANNKDETRGSECLARAFNELLDPLRTGTELRCEFKLFQVRRNREHVTTRQFIAISGSTSSGTLEQHATWTMRWTGESGDGPPRLERIDVEAFEQITGQGVTKPLFADCTASVLGHNASYAEQFLVGYEHWLARMQDTRYFSLLGTAALAVGDVNGDGLDDVYVGQDAGLPNRLFVQNADGTANDISESSTVNWIENCRGALLVDFDNDGDQDLAVATVGNVVLAANDGQGRFDIRKIVPTSDDTMSLCASDYDTDGDLDLYVCVYSPNDIAGETRHGSSATAAANFVLHDANSGGSNSLLRNDGCNADTWQFVDVTEKIGLDANNRRFSFAAAWEDFDNDGDQDLYVANDYGRNNLYENNPSDDGTVRFVDVAASRGVEDSATGMSVTWGDYDRDGWPDVYVSNMFSSAGNRITFQDQFMDDAPPGVRQRLQRFTRGNTLMRNRGDGSFEDVSLAANVNVGQWAWSSNFADLNSDGWEDLVIANGFITTEDTGDL